MLEDLEGQIPSLKNNLLKTMKSLTYLYDFKNFFIKSAGGGWLRPPVPVAATSLGPKF